jgi:phosphonate transport system substrate-binding protein
MKNCTRLLGALLALCLCAGCGGRQPASSSTAPSASASASAPAPSQLQLGTLNVELPRELDTAAARTAMERLPELLARQGVTAQIAVTYGTSYAATATALDAGGVDAAFLPAAEFVTLCAAAVPILADARPAFRADGGPAADWNRGPAALDGTVRSGSYALLCAAPTAYGKNLAGRGASDLSWDELNRARWGVLGQDSLAGSRCAELYLEDHYDGSGLGDLSRVTVYDGWDALLAAAAAGEVDVLALSPQAREDGASRWTQDGTHTDSAGRRGLGREKPIWQELPVLAVTPRLYDWVTAVTPGRSELAGDVFPGALAAALTQAFSGPAEQRSAIGAERYAAVSSADLNGVRRLAELQLPTA